MALPFQKPVTLVKNPGSPEESRATVQGHIQPDKGYFPPDTQVSEGDVIEVPDRRGGVRRLVVGHINVHDYGSDLDHLEVVWGEPPVERKAAVRRLGVEGLHSAILDASSDLFTDGHYGEAIFAAFRAVEVRVREMSHLELTGQKLMSEAFTDTAPRIHVAIEPGLLGKDEQRGRRRAHSHKDLRTPRGQQEPANQPGSHRGFTAYY